MNETHIITAPRLLTRDDKFPLDFDAVQLAFKIHESLEGALAWDTADVLNGDRISRMYHRDANELAHILCVV